MLLSVVIVTYNHQEMVKKLLSSIEKNNDIGDELEVIVVDNSPQNIVIEYLNKENFGLNLVMIKNKNNGYGCANNLGAKTAKSEYLLFLNPDTILVEPIFKYVIEKFKSCDMFGLKLITNEYKKNFSYRCNLPYSFKSFFLNRVGKWINIFNPKYMYILGADIFIKKDLFLEVGMFDENIFMYNEEYDLTKRVLKKTKKIKYFSKRKIIHLEGSGEYEKHDYLQRERHLISYRYVCEKHKLKYYKYIKKQYKFLLLIKFIKKIMFKNCKNLDKLIELYKLEFEKRG